MIHIPGMIEMAVDPAIEPYLRKYLELEDQINLISLAPEGDALVLKCAPQILASAHETIIENPESPVLEASARQLRSHLQNVILGMTFMHYRLEILPQEDPRFSLL